MSLSKQYPADVSIDVIKHSPTFGDKVCPFSKLPEEKKWDLSKCPAFKSGCPFQQCQTVGDIQGKLGDMRDQCAKGGDAYLQFMRDIVQAAKKKEIDVGSKCPFFQTKGGCPFAKDAKGEPILSPDYIVAPMSITLQDLMFTCPAFGKGVCPYVGLVTKCKGIAANCPAFKEGCPFKNCKTIGEFVDKLTQMRDTGSKGKAAYEKFFEELRLVNVAEQEKLGACPFNAHVCVFKSDAEGKPIIPK